MTVFGVPGTSASLKVFIEEVLGHTTMKIIFDHQHAPFRF